MVYYKSVSAIAGGGKTAVLLNTFSKGLARCSGSNWVFFPDPNWLCAPGANKAISSGRALPSMKQFLNICEHFEITPLQFFDDTENTPQLVRKALDGIRTLSDDDLIILLGLIARLNQEK